MPTYIKKREAARALFDNIFCVQDASLHSILALFCVAQREWKGNEKQFLTTHNCCLTAIVTRLLLASAFCWHYERRSKEELRNVKQKGSSSERKKLSLLLWSWKYPTWAWNEFYIFFLSILNLLQPNYQNLARTYKRKEKILNKQCPRVDEFQRKLLLHLCLVCKLQVFFFFLV